MQFEQHRNLSLSMLVCVVDREKKEKTSAILEKQHTFFTMVSLGKGTASSPILKYLGLGDTEKAVFMSVLPSEAVPSIMGALDQKLELAKPGHGFAFTNEVRDGCYHTPVEFTGREETNMEQTLSHDLLIVILHRGFSDDVMDVARAAGAPGGTVLHARGCGHTGAQKFFGVTIQPEKEMLMIVSDHEKSCDIMAAIADKMGPGTPAAAISFAMPVSAVRGISDPLPKHK